MQATFTVKNFGPIESATLDMRNVNVFIGPQSSGKSTLAKLYTICSSPLSFLEGTDFLGLQKLKNTVAKSFDAIKFEQALRDLNIHSFLNANSFVEFESDLHYFKYSKGKIDFKRKFEERIKELERLVEEGKIGDAQVIMSEFSEKILKFEIDAALELFNLRPDFRKGFKGDIFNYVAQFSLKNEELTHEEIIQLLSLLEKNEENMLSQLANYVPAERILIPVLKGSTFGLMNNNVALPKHILNFATAYENATKNVTELDLSFIQYGLSYKQVNGVDRIFFSPRKSITLSESATGIQSLVPLLLPIKNDSAKFSRSYVIEEPEINLFPKAQYSLIKFLEEERRDGTLDTTYSHTYTTHSPYILSAFNNMLYAFKKWENSDKSDAVKEEIEHVLPKGNWLNPNNFNAYSIENGTAEQILDRDAGLIGDNLIDEISDEMSDDFDSLLGI